MGRVCLNDESINDDKTKKSNMRILVLEGNKIELWEPKDIEYDKIVEGRTK
jgi:hypothetical protein